jgi:hypothetical protein
MPIKKPTKMTRKLYDWSKCTKFIEQKYKIDTRDYAGSHLDFSRWCEATGEKQVRCPEGTAGDAMIPVQEQFARYQSDVNSGKFQDRPYEDFWHWLIDTIEIHRGGTIELDKELGEGAKPWQQEILGLYLKEFGKGPYLTDW